MFESIKQKFSNLKDKAKTLRKKIGKPAFLCATFALSPALVACYGPDFPEEDYQVGDPCYENYCDRYDRVVNALGQPIDGILNVCEDGIISEQVTCTGEGTCKDVACDSMVGVDCTEADNRCLGTTSITCVEGKTVATRCTDLAGCVKETGKCRGAEAPEADTSACVRNMCDGDTAVLCLDGTPVRQECGAAGCNEDTGECNK
ncbi:MAG: hypothetical protein II180_10565 [Proteobacteria bacterium]|nr:hypothetical protein [Pseudomonadota bacterium]